MAVDVVYLPPRCVLRRSKPLRSEGKEGDEEFERYVEAMEDIGITTNSVRLLAHRWIKQ